MNVNQKIERALSDYVGGNIWPLSCPLEEQPEKWIVYNPEIEEVELSADDEDLEWGQYMQVHWFAKGQVNYIAARKEIRSLLRNAGFSVTDMDQDYEEDTDITHLVFYCNIVEE